MTTDKSHRLILEQIARRAMLERGLLPDFSAESLAELSRIHSPATADPEQARDLRALLWASIDNDDSRDLDQLTVAEALPNGEFKLLVAVADVDALVVKGSALDRQAGHNTTSVYTAATIFPMLPEKLSTDFTSLNGQEDRSDPGHRNGHRPRGVPPELGGSSGPWSAVRPSWPTTAWPPGWRGADLSPKGWPPFAGWMKTSACRIGRPRA